MNLQDIKDLMKEFNDSDIYKLSLEMDDVKLELEKEEPIQQIVAAPSAVMPTPVAAAPTAAPAAVPEASACEQQEGTPVKSPVVGVFSASAPDAPAYVQVGDRDSKGQTLCIIEAMKMMNEIKAPVSGQIIEILAKMKVW
ncbi:MAG: acetyl-CoA carboxylase biotin carboxyl carrier protein [Acutalibacteraceae bacterium]